MFDLFAELSGLVSEVREHRLVMLRIAEALERVSPPLRAEPVAASHPESDAAPAEEDSQAQAPVHYLAESPEEYMSRLDHEASLAVSLGVAPWSPEFQKTIMEVRSALMKPRRYQDEEGSWQTRPALTEAEADEAVREGFRLAKAEANVRTVRTGAAPRTED